MQNQLAKIKNIVIQGAGAMGALYASKFQDAGDFSVALLASERHYERLKTDGLVINGRHYNLPVIQPGDQVSPADLTIVGVNQTSVAMRAAYSDFQASTAAQQLMEA